MDADRLLIATLDDLAERINSPMTEYEVLGIAALLRRLLLDSPPLLDVVNREHRLKVRFVVANDDAYRDMVLGDGAMFWSAQDGLDPETSLPGMHGTLELNRDQFLARPVMASRGRLISVRDVITHGANVAGAVHLTSQPKDESHQEISGWAEALGIGGYPAGTRELQAIGRVVLKALAPVRAAAQANAS